MKSVSKDRVIDVLCKCGPCTIQELGGKIGDLSLIELRKILSDLLREGIVDKKPDYDKGKLVFIVNKKYC